jgi:hypothetical protein
MVDAGQRGSDETSGESEGALMARRETNDQRAVSLSQETGLKPETILWLLEGMPVLTAQRAESLSQDTGLKPETIRWVLEGIPVLTAEDPDSEDPKRETLEALEGRARENIKQLAKQIHRCCSDKKFTSYQKRVACEQLVTVLIKATKSMGRLLEEFPQPFREIAEKLPYFPCLFPARTEELRSLQKFLWDEFNLGKRHTLKLRAAQGRKTFSTKTWVNSFLMRLIAIVYECNPIGDYADNRREVAFSVPLTPENVKQWLDLIWKLLLTEIPEPEKHPRLRQLGGRPSKVHDVRATIKAKLGTYLERMLNDHAVHI